MDNKLIKESVASILKNIAPLDNELKSLYRALEAIRGVCPHDKDKNMGHGHNYTIYECETCGRIVHW